MAPYNPPPSCTMSPGCPCPTCWGAWISSVPASRANPSVSPDDGRPRMMNGGFGHTSHPPLAIFDPDSSSLRMCQGSLLPGVSTLLRTLPASGTMRSGVVWDRATLELPTGGSGGSVLDTTEGSAGTWPTVTVCGNHNSKGVSQTSGDGLATAAEMFASGTWGTPRASDSKDGADGTAPLNGYLSRQTVAWSRSMHGDLLTRAGLTPDTIGPLSPYFAEWLMGWPPGWTGLKPLETGSTRLWRQQLMGCLAVALGFGERQGR